jgi:hypothetical protein
VLGFFLTPVVGFLIMEAATPAGPDGGGVAMIAPFVLLLSAIVRAFVVGFLNAGVNVLSCLALARSMAVRHVSPGTRVALSRGHRASKEPQAGRSIAT